MPQISLASNHCTTAPRLEFFQHGSKELQRVTIDSSPFSIGRCETCDLRIDSAQVSREHAQIYRRGNIWTIRDLGSTNGTQVNGKAVRESFLSDGDILSIAETEVTFVASSVTPFQRMATQPIQHREAARPPALLADEIAKMRSLAEATLWQATPLQLVIVASLTDVEIEAYFAQATGGGLLPDADLQGAQAPAVARNYRELVRRRSIELVPDKTPANRIFVGVEAAEFEAPADVLRSLRNLRDQLPLDCELGITISLAHAIDFAAIDDVCREARHAELLLAFADFQGSSGQVLELESRAPDYLLLSGAMLKGVAADSQPLRRLELVLTTCQQLCIKPVLPACGCHRTIELCRQLGYDFALKPQVAPESAERVRAVSFVG